jgi:hypothetical protein
LINVVNYCNEGAYGVTNLQMNFGEVIKWVHCEIDAKRKLVTKVLWTPTLHNLFRGFCYLRFELWNVTVCKLLL